jgi:hypothetical protein
VKGTTKITLAIVSLSLFVIVPIIGSRSENASKDRVAPQTSVTDEKCSSGHSTRETASTFVFLYDISRSFHSLKPDSPFVRSVEKLPSIVQGLSIFPVPQRHRVGVISSYALTQRFVCEVAITGKVFTRECPNRTTQDQLKNCQASLREIIPAALTDITGALKYAALTFQHEGEQAQGLILFTDLIEDLGRDPHREKSRPDLKGLCVAIYFDITEDVPRHPQRLDARITAWREDLRTYGAKDSFFALLDSFNTNDLVNFFYKCAKSA